MLGTIVERLTALVAVESVTGNEGPICDFLAQELANCSGYECQRLRNTLLLRPKVRRHKALVGFFGHLDTVPPSRPNPTRIESGRVYGTGSADMKSGVALMWDLIANPVASPRYDLAFIFYDGEEGPYQQSGLGPALERFAWLREIGLAFCLEPSNNVLQLGCLGNLQANIVFEGRSAHSARPWQGDNAIYKAIPLLEALAARLPRVVTTAGLEYREVLVATMAEGGRARNMVPDRFAINVNFRFAPDRSLDDAEKHLIELVGNSARVEFRDRSPAGRVPEANPVLDHFRRVCVAPPQPKQAWTDVARLSAAGIDAVNFGPGDNAEAHQPNESTSIALLEEGNALLRRFIAGE